jgi:hypothetical protein
MAENNTQPRLDYTDSRDDIAETYPSHKNDIRDYGPRARGIVESAGVEIVPEEETPTEILSDAEPLPGTSLDGDVDTDTEEDTPLQLQLLPEARSVPLRFRLSKQTRETGRREIKKIREHYFDNKNE